MPGGFRALSPAGDNCAFHRTFSQELSADPSAVKRFQKPSLPFVFHLPVLPPHPQGAADCRTGTRSGGDGDQPAQRIMSPRLRPMCAAFDLREEWPCPWCRFSPLTTLETGPRCDSGTGTGIGEEVSTLSLQGIEKAVVLDPGTVTVEIITPLRLLAEGRPLRQFPFPPSFGLSSGGFPRWPIISAAAILKFDYKWLAEQSRTVQCVAGAVTWEERGNKWSGLTGTVTLGSLVGVPPLSPGGRISWCRERGDLWPGALCPEEAGNFIVNNAALDTLETGRQVVVVCKESKPMGQSIWKPLLTMFVVVVMFNILYNLITRPTAGQSADVSYSWIQAGSSGR